MRVEAARGPRDLAAGADLQCRRYQSSVGAIELPSFAPRAFTVDPLQRTKEGLGELLEPFTTVLSLGIRTGPPSRAKQRIAGDIAQVLEAAAPRPPAD